MGQYQIMKHHTYLITNCETSDIFQNIDSQVESVAKLVQKGNIVEVENIDMKIAVGQIK